MHFSICACHDASLTLQVELKATTKVYLLAYCDAKGPLVTAHRVPKVGLSKSKRSKSDMLIHAICTPPERRSLQAFHREKLRSSSPSSIFKVTMHKSYKVGTSSVGLDLWSDSHGFGSGALGLLGF